MLLRKTCNKHTQPFLLENHKQTAAKMTSLKMGDIQTEITQVFYITGDRSLPFHETSSSGCGEIYTKMNHASKVNLIFVGNFIFRFNHFIYLFIIIVFCLF